MNKYNFDFAVSAEINADTVKKMIQQVVEQQTGRKVKSVVLEIGLEYEDRPGGGSYPVFKRATVNFERENHAV